MIQFSVCCLTAVRRKASKWLVWESCCRAGGARALWELQPGLAETRPGFGSHTELLLWGASRIPAVPSAGRLQGIQVKLGEPHLPLQNCRCARTRLLLLPPSVPSRTNPGLVFLCWASPAPADPEVGVTSNHLCPYGSLGLCTLAWMLIQGSLP